jgi:hypothetical protein
VCDGKRLLDTATAEMQLEAPSRTPKETTPKKWNLELSNLTKLLITRTAPPAFPQVRVMAEPGVDGVIPAVFQTIAPPALNAALRHPTEVEPHSIATADAVLGLAHTLKKDVVAHVPDSAIYELSMALGSGSLNEIWENPRKFAISIDDGELLLIRPNFFARADRYRVRRKALEAWLGTFGVDRLPSLMDRYGYAKLAPSSAFMNNLDGFWVSLLDPSILALSVYDLPLTKLAVDIGAAEMTSDEIRIPIAHLSAEQLKDCVNYLKPSSIWSPDNSSWDQFTEPFWEPPTRKTFDAVTLQRTVSRELLANNGVSLALFSPVAYDCEKGPVPIG